MTLAGGALFGFWYALLLVSFASTIGASIAFLVVNQQDRIAFGVARDGLRHYQPPSRSLPAFSIVSASHSLRTIWSGVWRLRLFVMMSSPPLRTRDSS